MAEAGPTKGKIKFKIVSPLALIEEREMDSVLLPLEAGDMLILPRHAPLLASVKDGEIIVTNAGQKEIYFISSGVAEVRRDICTLCAWGMAEKNLNLTDIKKKIERLEKYLSSAHSVLEKQILKDLLSFLKKLG